VGMSLLTNLLSSVSGLSITRYIVIVLLAATLVEGVLLKHSYEAQGAFKAQLADVQQKLVNTQDAFNKAVASSAIDEAVCTTDQEQKQVNDKSFGKLQDRLHKQEIQEKTNAKGTQGVFDEQLSSDALSVFNDAECQAGADCPAPSSASGL